MSKGVLKKKSFHFAVRIVNLYKYLTISQKEYVLSKQILRSGTSVGANVREAEFAQSNLDFIHKLSISQKEINETLYWLELLKETDFIKNEEFESLNFDATELLKIITSSIKTMKSKIK
ncbi:four helix bundle protein [Bernardetia sp.]|uniref:four helix bundle protein n=1 Tax=Bernardetia sp. TaxID=1937974 RepID=UPI0025B80321|nr:four helix bundle protein [Bernardetia sp.]